MSDEERRRRLKDQASESVQPLDLFEAPSRKREWERDQRASGHVVTYRGIPRALQERIKEIAEAHRVKVGDVARRFLEHALDAFEAGELELTPGVVGRRYSLYPDQSRGTDQGGGN